MTFINDYHSVISDKCFYFIARDERLHNSYINNTIQRILSCSDNSNR